LLGTIAGIVLGVAIALLAGMFRLAPAALLHREASQLELSLGDALVGRAAASSRKARRSLFWPSLPQPLTSPT